MIWDTFRLKKDLVGEKIDNGMYASRFITLPANDTYESGYGFLISDKLVDIEDGVYVIALPDDYNVQLQMSPTEREPGKRYKRYKLTGTEIKDAVFFPYAAVRAAEEEAERRKKEEEQTKRDKKIIGKIVYGRYLGNSYGDDGDFYCDFFFYNGKRYYNHRHDKVQNVRALYTVMDGVSKYFFDTANDLIKKRANVVSHLVECANKLRKIAEPDETCLNTISLLDNEIERILETVRTDLQDERKE